MLPHSAQAILSIEKLLVLVGTLWETDWGRLYGTINCQGGGENSLRANMTTTGPSFWI
jgi:hypothetical protein